MCGGQLGGQRLGGRPDLQQRGRLRAAVQNQHAALQRVHVEPVPSPNPASIYLNVLWGVAIISRDDVWAVGSTDYNNTLILHWNGTSWS